MIDSKEDLVQSLWTNYEVYASYFPIKTIIWNDDLLRFLDYNGNHIRSYIFNSAQKLCVPYKFINMDVRRKDESLPYEFEWKLYPEDARLKKMIFLRSSDGITWYHAGNPEYSPKPCPLFETYEECFQYCIERNQEAVYFSRPSIEVWTMKMEKLISRYRTIVNLIGDVYGIQTTPQRDIQCRSL